MAIPVGRAAKQSGRAGRQAGQNSPSLRPGGAPWSARGASADASLQCKCRYVYSSSSMEARATREVTRGQARTSSCSSELTVLRPGGAPWSARGASADASQQCKYRYSSSMEARATREVARGQARTSSCSARRDVGRLVGARGRLVGAGAQSRAKRTKNKKGADATAAMNLFLADGAGTCFLTLSLNPPVISSADTICLHRRWAAKLGSFGQNAWVIRPAFRPGSFEYDLRGCGHFALGGRYSTANMVLEY